MISDEYRQMPLHGFDTVEALRKLLLSVEVSDDFTPSGAYNLTPENFLNAIENSVETVDFRESSLFYGNTMFKSESPEGGVNKVDLTIASNSTHEKQVQNLVHEMIHADRGKADFGVDSFIESHGQRSLKELEELFPDVLQEYINRLNDVTTREERIVSNAAEEFYTSHSSLAKLALCHIWNRYKTGI